MAERYPTDNTTTLWPPPPATPAAPAVEALPPVRPRNSVFADVFVYGAVWTLAALTAFAAAWAVAVRSPVSVVFLLPLAVFFLVVFWPLNVIWLTCTVTFSLLHRALLGRLEKYVPAGSAGILLTRSVLIGLGLGPFLAVVACLVASLGRLPGPYEGLGYAPNDYHATIKLLMYGVSSWLASVIAGWALGWLWTRRKAARKA